MRVVWNSFNILQISWIKCLKKSLLIKANIIILQKNKKSRPYWKKCKSWDISLHFDFGYDYWFDNEVWFDEFDLIRDYCHKTELSAWEGLTIQNFLEYQSGLFNRSHIKNYSKFFFEKFIATLKLTFWLVFCFYSSLIWYGFFCIIQAGS